MSINNLFESKKVRFYGILPYATRKEPIWANPNLYCEIKYDVLDGSKDYFDFTEILGTVASVKGEDVEKHNARENIRNRILMLQQLFTDGKENLENEIRFANLECTGIFYNGELIAITNDEGKKCLDPLLKNEAKDIEEFKKEFIKLKEVELEKERYMHEKRAEEICAEISHIIQHTS